MSRVGNKPIEIPDNVDIKVEASSLTVSGPKGKLQRDLPLGVQVALEGSRALLRPAADSGRKGRAMHGLARALLQNMVTGVSHGFSRVLEINGVGYRAESRAGFLSLALGYSHPIEVILPEGISAKVEKNTVTLSGIDKESLGQIAAIIRDQRPPEPFKGKGIKYQDEVIRRKVGKAGAG